MKFSVSIILETRTPRKNGTYPVKLRVIINRKARYYGLNIHLTRDQFGRIINPPPKTKLSEKEKEIKTTLEKELIRAEEILKSLVTPNFQEFKHLFTMRGEGGNVWKYYEDYIAECYRENRIGTAISYEYSRKSLEKIKGIKNLNFKDITPEWLKDYQNKIEAAGKAISTIGIYLKPLRFLFRKAISDGIIHEKYYPFDKYKIPSSENNKRPLEKRELQLLANYSGNPIYEYYRDFFMLSYYLVGLNFADLLTLKWRQYDGERITLVRSKIKRTTLKKQTPIELYVNEEARAIIQRHCKPGGTYIFGIIDENDSPVEIKRKVNIFIVKTNKALKAIALETSGINPKISTVFARHSAATHALLAGASLVDISRALGHKNIQTTSNYLSSLGEGARILGESLRVKPAEISELKHFSSN